MSFTAATLNPSTPRPSCAAFAYVGGLPAATHIGGCGFFHGFGRTLRVGIFSFGYGIRNAGPSCEYSVVRHIFGNYRITSSHTAFVTSVFGMAKPVTSRLPG